jgi:hypothetical protein
MRARNIKPGFFLNCELSEVDFASRLLFIGLWCYADREGRFEWKPKQIKAAIFPYDQRIDIEKLLCNLMSLDVITCHDAIGYIENFKKHQNPHPHEAKSTLSEKPQLNQCHDMSCNVTKCTADVIIPDTMNPDIIIQNNIVDKSTNHPSVLMALWNQIVVNPKVTALSKTRESKSRLRLSERSKDDWVEIMTRISQTPFLKGENDRGWRADFDWLISNDTNAVKVLEGKYDNSGRQTQFKTIGQRITENNLQAARDFIGEAAINDRTGQSAICYDDERDRGRFPV